MNQTYQKSICCLAYGEVETNSMHFQIFLLRCGKQERPDDNTQR